MLPQSNPKVLVVDSDPLSRSFVSRHLRQAEIASVLASDLEEALSLADDSIDCALVDLHVDGAKGYGCFVELSRRSPFMPVILAAGTGAVDLISKGLRAGAHDQISKPLHASELIARVQRAIAERELRRENEQLRKQAELDSAGPQLISTSQVSQRLMDQAKQIADLDAPVLLKGEAGTGKAALARWIHTQSNHCNGPLVSVNCRTLPHELFEVEVFGAVPRSSSSRPPKTGRLELAHEGTLLLKNVEHFPLSLQSKLLDFLRSGQINPVAKSRLLCVRVIATTTLNLLESCEAGEFRKDLYSRLAVLSLAMPTLNDRSDEVADVAASILARLFERESEIPPSLDGSAIKRLQQHRWTNHFRELEDVMERVSNSCSGGTIGERDLVFGPSALDRRTSLAGLTLAQLEAAAIRETLAGNGGNKALAARQLGISEKSIYNKMKRHGMK